MQVRLPWFGKLNELHGVRIGDELEVAFRARRGKRSVRVIPAEGGVRVVSTLPDGLMAETFVPARWSGEAADGKIAP